MSRSILTASLVTLGLALASCSAGTNDVQSASKNTCANEKATVETAIEAYYATNGAYPSSLADLVGTTLKDSPSARWTYTNEGATYTLTGIGDCA